MINVEEDLKQAAEVQAIGTVLRGLNILRQAKKAESKERMLDLMDTALAKFEQGAALAQQSGISELSQFFQELASGGESGQMEARAERAKRMRYEHLVGKERDFKSVPKVLRGTWRVTGECPCSVSRHILSDGWHTNQVAASCR